MSRSLPPGVTESMIPGNRPEDEWIDKFFDELEIPEFAYEFEPREYASILEHAMSAITAGYLRGFDRGREEGKIDAMSEMEPGE